MYVIEIRIVKIKKIWYHGLNISMYSRFICWSPNPEGDCLRGVCVLSCFSHVWLFVTLWTVASQALLSMGFSGQEYWSGLPCPPPEDLPDPGIKSVSLMSPALAGGFCTTSAPWEAQIICWPDVCCSVSQLCLQGLDTTERLNNNHLSLLVWNVPLLLCWILPYTWIYYWVLCFTDVFRYYNASPEFFF